MDKASEDLSQTDQQQQENDKDVAQQEKGDMPGSDKPEEDPANDGSGSQPDGEAEVGYPDD